MCSEKGRRGEQCAMDIDIFKDYFDGNDNSEFADECTWQNNPDFSPLPRVV